jgi:hypothetical protein
VAIHGRYRADRPGLGVFTDDAVSALLKGRADCEAVQLSRDAIRSARITQLGETSLLKKAGADQACHAVSLEALYVAPLV